MIIRNIKIFSQNIQKNNLIVNSILETKYNFDIIFVQELFWTTIYLLSSSRSCEGKELVNIPNYLN